MTTATATKTTTTSHKGPRRRVDIMKLQEGSWVDIRTKAGQRIAGRLKHISFDGGARFARIREGAGMTDVFLYEIASVSVDKSRGTTQHLVSAKGDQKHRMLARYGEL